MLCHFIKVIVKLYLILNKNNTFTPYREVEERYY